MPSDSLSREVARAVPVDTLDTLWTTPGPGSSRFGFPRTVRFLPDGDVAVSDAETNRLYRYSPEGRLRYALDAAFDVPYVAGVRGGGEGAADTVIVFNAGNDRFDWIAGGERLRDRSVTLQRPSAETLVYATATDTALYAKVIGDDVQGIVGQVGTDGQITDRMTLYGPYWRHAGFLRAWEDSLVSLSGFRPVVDVLPQRGLDAARPDTLALVGFDSPMLERSYAFLQGDASKAPLLTVSADAEGDSLYVLNLRPGWLRVDVYGRDGRLRRVFAEPGTSGSRNYYPRDVAVRSTDDGLVIAVVISAPEPRLQLFRWMPETE